MSDGDRRIGDDPSSVSPEPFDFARDKPAAQADKASPGPARTEKEGRRKLGARFG